MLNHQGVWNWLAENLRWAIIFIAGYFIVSSIKDKKMGQLVFTFLVSGFAFAFLLAPKQVFDVLSFPFKVLFGVG